MQRCLSISRAHSLLSKHNDALALLARALDLSTQTVVTDSTASSANTQGPPRSEISREQAFWLHQLLNGLVSQQRALVELYAHTVKAATAEGNKPAGGAPLIERLDDYPATSMDLTRLVTYPPRLEPIPVKPLFFDIAWNYIDYPGRRKQEVESREQKKSSDVGTGKGEERKEAKRGWFGFGRS